MPETQISPDIQINYDQLHLLADKAKLLKVQLGDDVPGLGTGFNNFNRTTDEIGHRGLTNALRGFGIAWDQPFKSSLDRLGDLAQLFDGVATRFFETDADFAGRAQSTLTARLLDQWHSKQDAYELWQKTKDLKFHPSALWGQDGKLHDQEAIPLLPWEHPPAPPGPLPEHVDVERIWSEYIHDRPYPGDGKATTTDNTFDAHDRLISESTSVMSTTGLKYTEKTTYIYTGDSLTPSGAHTELSHSDGTTETIDSAYHEDGSVTTNNYYVDPQDSGNNRSSTTTTVFKTDKDHKPDQYAYRSVSVDQDGEETVVDVTNNDGRTDDTRTMTGDDGIVRKWKGDAETNDWEQIEGPSIYDEDADADDVADTEPGGSGSGPGEGNSNSDGEGSEAIH